MNKPIKGISFFCPAYNDADNIAHVINKASKVLSETCEGYEIIVINDGSPDNTKVVLEKLLPLHEKLKVINHPYNLGYAEALKSGFKHANKFEFMLFTDGDNQYDVNRFREMIGNIPEYDALITYRTENGNNFIRKVISWVFNRTLNILFGVPFKDLSSSFRFVKRSAINSLTFESEGVFLPVEIIIKLYRKNFKIKEMPIQTKRREHGRSTSLLPKNFVGAIVDMIKLRFRGF